jgi:hypothetical protein
MPPRQAKPEPGRSKRRELYPPDGLRRRLLILCPFAPEGDEIERSPPSSRPTPSPGPCTRPIQVRMTLSRHRQWQLERRRAYRRQSRGDGGVVFLDGNRPQPAADSAPIAAEGDRFAP